jgi:GGDEF domain-containing protein
VHTLAKPTPSGCIPPPAPADSSSVIAEEHFGLPWSNLFHILLLVILIVAVALGSLTVPPPVAIGTIMLLAGYVLLLSVGHRWVPLLGRPDLVVVLDLIVVTWLMVLSRDLNSPFVYLYYFVILEGVLRLPLRQALSASMAAACLIILLWLVVGNTEILSEAGFRLGAVIAGGFLLALFFGTLVQEHKARRQEAAWTALLDRRLQEATQKLEEQLQELQFHNDLVSQLSGELRTEGVAQTLLRFFLKATGLSRGAAYTIADDGAPQVAAVEKMGWDGDADSPAPPVLAFPEEVTGGEPVVVPVPAGDLPPGTVAVCLPLVHGGGTRAWLCALAEEGHPEPDESARRLIRGIAAGGIAAIEAAILYEEVQRIMRADPMRSLFSWSALEKLLGAEIDRCRELLLVFSVAEIRLQDLGTSPAPPADRDLALRRAVNLIQASLRRVDLLSYDGAGQFAILLPRMPKMRAMEAVQAIVAKLENDPVASRLLMVDRLDIAAGIVTFPEDGTNWSSMSAAVEGLLALGPLRPARVQVQVV